MSLLIIIGCGDDEPVTPTSSYESGVFIVNEGPFQSGTGTISFFNKNTDSVTHHIFETANSRPLGNIVQSMSIHNDKGYIVVNNANKIEVVDLFDFQSTATINGLELPRYFLGITENKAYVSQWGLGSMGSVKVLDLTTNTITKTIAAGTGAEKMLLVGNEVYVLNKGGFGADSTITVINTTTDEVSQTITVGHKPNSIQQFGAELLVLCEGILNWMEPTNSTAGTVWKINNGTPTLAYTFDSTASHPMHLFKANNMYHCVYNSQVRTLDTSNLPYTLTATPFINIGFYSITTDPVSGVIYGADAGDFQSDGTVFRYQSDGTLMDSFQGGVIPNGFEFR